MTAPADVLARFWAKVEKGDGCWTWLASKDTHGYGMFFWNGKNHRAHRASLLLHGRAIQDGLVVDHQCRNRACVNPDHLRLVDVYTNTHENSVSRTHLNALKTHCPSGHLYAGSNLIISSRGRDCRECKNAWLRALRKRKSKGDVYEQA